MKKMQMFLLAAMLVGVGSAFTASQPAEANDAYGWDGTQFIPVDRSLVNVQYQCNEGSSYCLYEDASFDHPIGTEDKTFVYLSGK